jgi:hypothetical protein
MFVQTIFGTRGGIGPDVDHVVHMKRTADRLLGDAWEWSALGAGRYRFGVGRRPTHGLQDEVASEPEEVDEAARHPLGP